MAKEKVIILKVDSKQAVDGIENVTDELDVANEKTSDLSGGLLDAAMNFKIMGVSINDVIKGLKALRVSLIATGIGAIAVAVGTLAAAFFSTQEGANALTRVIEPLSEVMGTLWGILQQMGSAMAKILSGDFEGGWDAMGKAVEGFGEKMEVAYERGQKLAELEIELAKNEAAHIKTLGSLNRQREEYRAIVDDETKSYEERAAALKNLEAVNNAIFNVTQDRALKELEILKIRTEANDTDYDAKVEIAKKEVELEEAAGRRAKQQKEEFLIARRIRGADTGDIMDVVSPITGLSTKEIVEVALMQGAIIKENADELLTYMENKNQAEIDSEKAKWLAKKQIQMAEADLLFQFGQTLEQFGEKNKAIAAAGIIVQQIASVAKIIWSTQVANAAAVAASPLTAGMPWVAINSISAGLSIASGLAASGSALSKLGKGGAGGGRRSYVRGTSAGSPAQVAPEFNIIGASATNQLADVINDRDSQPVKAYVVGSEVSTQQALDRNTIENATVI